MTADPHITLFDYKGHKVKLRTGAADADDIVSLLVTVDDPVVLTGDIVVDTLGALNDSSEVDPAAASATIPALLRGQLATLLAAFVAQGANTSGQKGAVVQGAVTTSAPTYTTAKSNPLSLKTTGELRVADASAATALGLLGTEVTLAAILAKIIAAPATSAKQDTGNTSLAALATAIGSVSDAAWSGTGDGSVISILKAIAVNTTPA